MRHTKYDGEELTLKYGDIIRVVSYFKDGRASDVQEITMDFIGATGPAGGKFFYDVDEDNDEVWGFYQDKYSRDGLESTKCGWRFLEASMAPESNKKVKFANDEHFTAETKQYVTSYKNLNPWSDLYVNERIGDGKEDTKIILKAFEEYQPAFDYTQCAAYLCDTYEQNGYNDYYLPSYYEVWKLYDNIIYNRNVSTYKEQAPSSGYEEVTYWSSTHSHVHDVGHYTEWSFICGDRPNNGSYSYRDGAHCITEKHYRPVRQFL